MLSTASPGTRLVARLIAPLAVVCVLLATPGQADAKAPDPRAKAAVSVLDMTRAEYEERLVYWINRARDHHSKRSISIRACVDGYAGRWARHLAVKEKFEHQELGPIMKNCRLQAAGEIIAMGTVSPRQMVRMWLNSPSHRDILLSRKYRLAGVGAYLGDNDAWYGVVDFGRR
jgi:uncharacterized protein YkwD